ncbi:MAG: hypothetical protein ACKOCT_05200, partial [Alphaproteobacteria bacterium]
MAAVLLFAGLVRPAVVLARRPTGADIERLERQIEALQEEVSRLKQREREREGVAGPGSAAGVAGTGDVPRSEIPAAAQAAAPPEPGVAAPTGAGGGAGARQAVEAKPTLGMVKPGSEIARPAAEAKRLTAGYHPGGFFIRDEKEEWQLRIGSYVQVDARFFPGDPSSLDPDQFL